MEAPTLDLVAISRTPDGSRPVTQEPIVRGKMPKPPTHFTSAQWSADGTTLFTTSSESRLSTYVLPADLLARDSTEPLTLRPQGTLVLAEGLGPIAPCPYFNIQDPSTQLVLTASREHPIHLYHPFQSDPASDAHQRPVTSYFQVNPMTEAYTQITAMIWPSTPTAPTSQFYTGSTSTEISIFDISASRKPINTIATTHKTARKQRVGLRGAISTLSVQDPECSYGYGGYGLLAAGTWTRAVGLYDLNRVPGCITSWGIPYNLKKWPSSFGSASSAETDCGTGNGITQILFSPCGQYMVVNERCTSALLVYDVRETYQLVARLIGRRLGQGNASQKLQADVYPGNTSTGGFEVWSGTGDGGLVVWEDVGLKEGDVKPTWEKKGITDGFACAVSGTAMHRTGSVVATISGSWTFVDDDGDSDSSDSDSDSESSEDEGESEQQNENGAESKDKDEFAGNQMDTSDTSSETSSDSSSSGGSIHLRNRLVVKETSLRIWSIRGVNNGSGDAAGEVATKEEEEVVDEWGRVRRCDTSYGEE
ncbi:hypothetical protein V8F20_006188 [Naviculisporaceae sp. PSN 640]